ncbi:MAG: hypothetical protein K0R66_401 [Gammaproteobacteria bacterium]|jgi:energy-coupling factor transporter ATP-binding protein EcfA2|nr:hypothetical protein [Gammaproteobacteria bacterium]
MYSKDYIVSGEVRLSDILSGSPSLIEAVDKTVPAKGKNLVLFIGPTGAGKSTLINYMLGCTFKPSLDEEGNTSLQLAEKSQNAAAMGSGIESCTFYPQIYDYPKSNVSFCDLPGFFDTRGVRERIITNMSIDMIAKGARQINGLVIVIEHDALYGEKARGFNKLMETLRHLFKNLHKKTSAELANIQNAMTVAFNLKGNKKSLAQIGSRLNALTELYTKRLSELVETKKRLTEESVEMEEALEEVSSTLVVLKLIRQLFDNSQFVLIEDVNSPHNREQLFAILHRFVPVPPSALSFDRLDPAQQEMNALLFKIAGDGGMCIANIDLAKAEMQRLQQVIAEIKASITATENELSQANNEAHAKVGDVESRLVAPKARLAQQVVILEGKNKASALLHTEIEQLKAELETVTSPSLVPCFSEEHEYSLAEKGARFVPGLVAAGAVMALNILANPENILQMLLGAGGALSAAKTGFSHFNVQKVVYNGIPFSKVERSKGLSGDVRVSDHAAGIFQYDINILASDSGKHYIKLLTEKRMMPGNPERARILLRKLGRNPHTGTIESSSKEHSFKCLQDEIIQIKAEISQLRQFISQIESESTDTKTLFDARRQVLEANLRESSSKLSQSMQELEAESKKLSQNEAVFKANLPTYELLQKIGTVLYSQPSTVFVSEDPTVGEWTAPVEADANDEFKLMKDFLAALSKKQFGIPAPSAPILFAPAAAGGAGKASIAVKPEIF